MMEKVADGRATLELTFRCNRCTAWALVEVGNTEHGRYPTPPHGWGEVVIKQTITKMIINTGSEPGRASRSIESIDHHYLCPYCVPNGDPECSGSGS
jgi:hypothetical protein